MGRSLRSKKRKAARESNLPAPPPVNRVKRSDEEARARAKQRAVKHGQAHIDILKNQSRDRMRCRPLARPLSMRRQLSCVHTGIDCSQKTI